MKKSILILIVTILVVLSIYIVSQHIRKNQQQENNETKELISKGMEFYSPEVLKNMRIDSYVFFKTAALYAKNEDYLLDENVYNNDPFIRFLNKKKQYVKINSLLEEIYPYPKDPENISVPSLVSEPLSGVLLKALYCDVVGYNDLDFDILKIFNHQNGSYGDTHFLIGLLYLKNNGCYNNDIIEKSIKEVVHSIMYAQKNDKIFSDLYVERIAVLYWAGYGQDVKEQWIDVVKNNFTNDPGWRARSDLNYSHPHTTGLALLDLIYFLEGKSQQSFY